MNIKWTVGMRLGAAFGAIVLIQLIVGGLAYRSLTQLSEDFQLVIETSGVLAEARDLRGAVKDVQRGQRGYIITGEEKYLAPYTAALEEIPPHLKLLRELMADDPDQQARLDALEPLIAENLAFTKNAIETRKSQGFETAQAEVLTDKGKQTMDDIHGVIADIVQAEETRLLEQRALTDATTRSAELTIIVGGIVAAVFTLLAAVFVTRSITSPLAQVVKQLRALAAGGADLTQRLTDSARDELGDLARAFNAFLESLGNIIRSLSDGAVKLSSSTSQINASVNEMAAGSESQNQQVARTSSSMEEITAAFKEVSRNTTSTADAAHAAVQRAQQGTARVQATLTELNESNVAFQQLRKRSAEISELVSLIANIASQTNILALNAAIEAAGAGAAGSRFDVVAEEIRKLAQRTTESTASITTTVVEIQKDIQSASERMERSVVQAQEAEQSLTDIVEGIASVNDMVNVISTATNQQVTAAGQVAEALQVITQVTQQTAQAAGETARTTNDLAGLAQSLRETSGKFKI